jgi:hypothetical protein
MVGVVVGVEGQLRDAFSACFEDKPETLWVRTLAPEIMFNVKTATIRFTKLPSILDRLGTDKWLTVTYPLPCVGVVSCLPRTADSVYPKVTLVTMSKLKRYNNEATKQISKLPRLWLLHK